MSYHTDITFIQTLVEQWFEILYVHSIDNDVRYHYRTSLKVLNPKFNMKFYR